MKQSENKTISVTTSEKKMKKKQIFGWYICLVKLTQHGFNLGSISEQKEISWTTTSISWTICSTVV